MRDVGQLQRAVRQTTRTAALEPPEVMERRDATEIPDVLETSAVSLVLHPIRTPRRPRASHGIAPPIRPRPARPNFLERPGDEARRGSDDAPRHIRQRLNASAGIAFDVLMAGRAIDAPLLRALARSDWDPIDRATQVAELSGMGMIDGKAFEQITNQTTGYAADTASLEDRVAFALAVKRHDPLENNNLLDSVMRTPRGNEPSSPLTRLWKAARTGESFETWSTRLTACARELLAAARQKTLLSSPACVEILREDLMRCLRRDGHGRPGDVVGDRWGAKGLLTAKRALERRLSLNTAIDYADRAERGEIDVVTLLRLAPSDNTDGYLRFELEPSLVARTHAVSWADAVGIAADVARDDLTYGQICGFFLRYGRTSDGCWPRLNLNEVSETIKGVNRGELAPATLERILDPNTIIPEQLGKVIGSRMFSAKIRGAPKYDAAGAAPGAFYTQPLTIRMTQNVIRELAGNDELLQTFSARVQKEIAQNLPSARKMWWERMRVFNGESIWELQDYVRIVEAAFETARRETGIRLRL